MANERQAGPDEAGHKAGFVALVGQPNAGKSTLLNRLVGEKVAIATPKPQTTRTRILGVVNLPGAQVAFLDTPGIHEAKGGLNRMMVETALGTLGEVDLVLLVVDAERLCRKKGGGVDPADRRIAERIAAGGRPAILGINKVDLVDKARLLPIIQAYEDVAPWRAIFPFSARTGDGVDALARVIVENLPDSPPLFPDDVLTDQAERLLAAEYIREQVIRLTRAEIPYATGVEVIAFDESEREEGKQGLVRIEANVVVERSSQKAIVIGKGGAMLKRIGTAARKDLERLLGVKVWLGLHVRVEKDWTRTHKGLRKLGYT